MSELAAANVISPFCALRFQPPVPVAAATYLPAEASSFRADRAGPEPHLLRVTWSGWADPQTTWPDRGAELFRAWVRQGVVRADSQPALYVYEQECAGLRVRGLVAAVGPAEGGGGGIHPHEEVIPARAEHQLALMRAARAQLEPIMLTYRGGTSTKVEEELRSARRAVPLADVRRPDGSRHRVWALTDPRTQDVIVSDLSARPLVIADGHHRYAAYRRLHDLREGPADGTGLALLVDADRHPLRIHAIHREVSVPVAVAVKAVAAEFAVTAVAGPLDQALAELAACPGPRFLLAGGGRRWLVSRPGTLPGSEADEPELDVAVVDVAVIDGLLGAPEVLYHHDAQVAVAAAERAGSTAIVLHPVAGEEVDRRARRGIRLPRKSTSYEPKPLNGLLMLGW